ncbi:protein ANTAGONIST OF LIKE HETEROCHROMATIN PROTEIN 1-like [Odontomachus brunneus]|uniref:protein ANTAGONIST OF LIKE HETEROCHROMATIN PROTEIN 1-like n=1 Tax=Odontomachus brunneus TaxID=486640 RepID=UPI0013F2288D|nr:protein ANTAGONIST OF LIKE HETEROCHROMATIN PROTEIN 1-like [Odontomachus brunneus]
MRAKREILVLFWLLSSYYYLIKRRRPYKRWINRRWHTRPINKLRHQFGHYNTLFQELKKDESMFFKYVRMSNASFEKLLQQLQPHLIKRSHRALPPDQRLLIGLRFLGTGDQTTSIALDFRVGESTVRMLYKEICSIIMRILPSMYLSPPTEQQWIHIANNYWKRGHMPNCFGAIDGKHIILKCSPNSGSSYYNYKKQHSIILMAVADYRYKFTLVDIGAYGGNSDGGIFADSEIGERLRNNNLNLPNGTAALPGCDIAIPGFSRCLPTFK